MPFYSGNAVADRRERALSSAFPFRAANPGGAGLHVIELFPMPIPVGAKAPDFTLKTKTADGLKDIVLSDQLKKSQVVLLFFPLAYTGTCTAQMCDMSNGLENLHGL